MHLSLYFYTCVCKIEYRMQCLVKENHVKQHGLNKEGVMDGTIKGWPLIW